MSNQHEYPTEQNARESEVENDDGISTVDLHAEDRIHNADDQMKNIQRLVLSGGGEAPMVSGSMSKTFLLLLRNSVPQGEQGLQRVLQNTNTLLAVDSRQGRAIDESYTAVLKLKGTDKNTSLTLRIVDVHEWPAIIQKAALAMSASTQQKPDAQKEAQHENGMIRRVPLSKNGKDWIAHQEAWRNAFLDEGEKFKKKPVQQELWVALKHSADELAREGLRAIFPSTRGPVTIVVDSPEKQSWVLVGQFTGTGPRGEDVSQCCLIKLDARGRPDGSVSRASSVVQLLGIGTDKKIQARRLKDMMVAAEATALNEQRDPAHCKDFEPVRPGKKLGYIALAGADDMQDPKYRETHLAYPELLSQRYDVYTTSTARADVMKEGTNPAQRLREHVATQKSEGIRSFYIQIWSHGYDDGFHFAKNTVLKPDDIFHIFKENADCTFTLNTPACHGAGMSDAMKRFRDVPGAKPGRVTVIVQTKSDSIALSHKTDNNPMSSAYLSNFAGAFLKKNPDETYANPTYGAAHLQADKEAKNISGFDATFWSSNGQQEPIFTAMKSVPQTEKKIHG